MIIRLMYTNTSYKSRIHILHVQIIQLGHLLYLMVFILIYGMYVVEVFMIYI